LLAKSITTVDTDTNGTDSPHLIHARTTNTILSAAYRVHSKLGPGLLEKPYRVCLEYELARHNLRVEAEKVFPIHYDDISLDIGYRVDLLVEERVIVEVKAVENILPIHEAQLLSYLRLSGIRVGLLINFNVVRLRDGIRRRICGW
jgi:GxxExxY protein